MAERVMTHFTATSIGVAVGVGIMWLAAELSPVCHL